LDNLATVVGLFVWSAYGVYPKGNYPKSTSLLLLNCRYSLLEGAWLFAFEIWLKQALNFNIEDTDLVTLFIKNQSNIK
jgi:drug/metabolite transporter (DMT)-like permease